MYALLVTILGVFLGEHLGRLYDITYRPSFYLWWTANKAQYFWEVGGRIFAIASSFVHELKLEEIFLSIRSLAEPSIRIVFSPFHFFKGYSKVMEAYKFPILITVGSVILVALALYACRRSKVGRRICSLWNRWRSLD